MRRTTQQWLALFQAQNDSDLSIKDFCLEQGGPPPLFTNISYKNSRVKQKL